MCPPPLRRGAAIGAIAAAALLAACAPTRPAAVNPAPAAAIIKPTAAGAKPAAALGAVAQPTADGPRVQIKDFAFAPKEIAVPVGTALTWTNKDSEPHTVTTSDKAIASQAMDTDEQFAFEFDRAGTYTYHCSLHPYMTATVVVR
jgi:plastocyanin